MKKKVKIIILSCVLAVLVIGGSVAYAMLPHPLNYKIKDITPVDTASEISVAEESEDFVAIKKSGDDFKVLMFTDMHLDGKNKTSILTVTNLVNNIVREKPDLVILGGDNVTSAFNKKRANQLARIFEELGVYWAPILGNHEGDNGFSVSRSDMVDIFASYEHCLMRQGPADIDGNGNYALAILNADDTVKRCFFFMDTFDEMSDELKTQYNVPLEDDPYDGTRENQVAWYGKRLASLKEKYGDFTSSIVVHIPIPQYKTGFEANLPLIHGEKLEKICASGFDSGLFDAIKAGKSTDSVFCGHDHLNTFAIDYEGVMLCYMQPSGYGSYTAASRLDYEEKDWLQGYTRLLLKTDGTFAIEKFRNSALAE